VTAVLPIRNPQTLPAFSAGPRPGSRYAQKGFFPSSIENRSLFAIGETIGASLLCSPTRASRLRPLAARRRTTAWRERGRYCRRGHRLPPASIPARSAAGATRRIARLAADPVPVWLEVRRSRATAAGDPVLLPCRGCCCHRRQPRTRYCHRTVKPNAYAASSSTMESSFVMPGITAR